jgi:hypothetical protein
LGRSSFQHIKLFGGGPGNINDTAFYKRAAVIDTHHDPLAVYRVGNDEYGTKRQIRVRRRELIRIKKLARSRRPSFKFRAIPGSDAFLPETAAACLCLCGAKSHRKKAAYGKCAYFFHIKNPPSKKYKRLPYIRFKAGQPYPVTILPDV